jgi:sigma-B regulation protein RsbU (phosphoserine phosphatase)
LAEKQERLLIITPNPDQLAPLISLIEELGYAVVPVQTIKLAQNAIDAGQINLVILDGRALDEKEQEKLGNFVSQNSSEFLPMLVLAEMTDMDQVSYFVDRGADDFMQAPFDKTQVRLRITSNLERCNLISEQEEHLQSAELLKIEQDVLIARQIQAGFLPKELPQPDGWEIAARFEPAREVAGDWYDSFYLSQGRRVGFVIADVVDKGVPAALFMALVRSLTRAFAQQHYALGWTDALEGSSPARRKKGKKRTRRLPSTGTIALHNAVLITHNYIMDNHMDLNMFATLFFGMFDPRNGDLAYINAGHNPPFIVSRDGEIRAKLTSTGPAVGMFPGVTFQTEYGKIEPGDTLFAYTDGVTEARAPTGEFLTEKRLVELLSRPTNSALEVVDRIDNVLKDFIADAVPFDDITMIAIHRESQPESE